MAMKRTIDGHETAYDFGLVDYYIAIIPEKNVALAFRRFLGGLGPVSVILTELRSVDETNELRNMIRMGELKGAYMMIDNYNNRPLQRATASVKKK